jgi:hypothetical protein
LDLDFIKVKRKTRSQPATPKGSPTREGARGLGSNAISGSVDKKTLRKSSDDGRYLFLKDSETLASLQPQQSTSTPSTPVCSQADIVPPKRSKSVRTFVELISSQNTSATTMVALGDHSKPISISSEKLKDQSGSRVSKVCVILNDAELLVVSNLLLICWIISF